VPASASPPSAFRWRRGHRIRAAGSGATGAHRLARLGRRRCRCPPRCPPRLAVRRSAGQPRPHPHAGDADRQAGPRAGVHQTQPDAERASGVDRRAGFRRGQTWTRLRPHPPPAPWSMELKWWRQTPFRCPQESVNEGTVSDVIFLLGAGASMDAGMPSVAQLTVELSWRSEIRELLMLPLLRSASSGLRPTSLSFTPLRPQPPRR
jgi:hypothetical protein